MTLFFVGVAVGLILHWIYRRIGKSLLGETTWRQRALASFSHDDFVKLNESVREEYSRRFGRAA